jgi:hypothetical protein
LQFKFGDCIEVKQGKQKRQKVQNKQKFLSLLSPLPFLFPFALSKTPYGISGDSYKITLPGRDHFRRDSKGAHPL